MMPDTISLQSARLISGNGDTPLAATTRKWYLNKRRICIIHFKTGLIKKTLKKQFSDQYRITFMPDLQRRDLPASSELEQVAAEHAATGTKAVDQVKECSFERILGGLENLSQMAVA
jgi:hypothetical protein